MSKIYGLLASVPEQDELIKNHCFGDCGQISMGGAIVDDKLGVLFVCCQEECPYQKKVTDEPIGKSEWTGDDIYLRSLKEPNNG